MIWRVNDDELLRRAKLRIRRFCATNSIPTPKVNVMPKKNWYFGPCAFYRPDTVYERKTLGKLAGEGYGVGINVCMEKCQRLCVEHQSYNYSWPGHTADRTVYGVVAHELGHHCDWCASDSKGVYFGDYSAKVCEKSGERKLTGYCPNDGEWFAEMFRLFVTNHALLRQLRPKTYAVLRERWEPVGPANWADAMGEDLPRKIWWSLVNKGCKAGVLDPPDTHERRKAYVGFGQTRPGFAEDSE